MEVVRGSDRAGPAVVGGLLLVLVAAGALGRGPADAVRREGEATSIAASPSATAGGSASGSPAVTITFPSSDRLWYRTASLPVRGTATNVADALSAVAVVGRRVIGRGSISIDADGRFAAMIPVVPPARRSRAVLRLYPPGRTQEPVAIVRYELEAGSDMLLWSPTPDTPPADDRSMTVTGPVLGDVREVWAVLRGEEGELIAEARTSVPPRRAGRAVDDDRRVFELELRLPPHASGSALLHVMGLAATGGRELEHIDIRVALTGTPETGAADGQPPR